MMTVPTFRRQEGFTLVELMLATAITLIVLATATGTFNNALLLTDTATLTADSNQNLRAAVNVLARDLMQAGRGIPTDGIPIPAGLGAGALLRPAPPSFPPVVLNFDNTTQTRLSAIITGDQLGPLVNGRRTDIVTMLALDPTSYVEYPAGSSQQMPLNLKRGPLPNPPWPTGITEPVPALADDGGSLTVGQFSSWISDPVSGIKPGDLLLFTNRNSPNAAIQTVTGVSGTTVSFAAGDPFRFNQRGAAQGSIVQIRSDPIPAGDPAFPPTEVVRIEMLTYYLDGTTLGEPRLVRQLNFPPDPTDRSRPRFEPQALAGMIDDLRITYDLMDDLLNPVYPVNQPSLPAIIGGKPFGASQIRKANLRVGVRSEARPRARGDYLRNTISTVVSLRSLAYIDRY